MFDIGFAELLVIGVVALLVIGPERLPETVRTASQLLGRLRRGFNDIKREVQQELHNDEVMRELRKTGEQIQQDVQGIERSLTDAGASAGSGSGSGSGENESAADRAGGDHPDSAAPRRADGDSP